MFEHTVCDIVKEALATKRLRYAFQCDRYGDSERALPHPCISLAEFVRSGVRACWL